MKLTLKHKPAVTTQGYDLRQNKPNKFTIIVHSTNGAIGSAFSSEVNYLLYAKDVSSHFIISKTGEIVQFFDDISKYRAWHAGTVRSPIYNNNNSIGIECHYTPGEVKYLPEVKAALTDLTLFLRKNYTIIDVETHRNVATPKGRKQDPSHMSDAEFYAWKNQVLAAPTQGNTPIIGQSNISIDILRHKLTQKGVLLYEIDPIICAYTAYGELTRAGNVYPLAQWATETGWGTSDRWRISHNAAGMGANDDGTWGERFASISEGILAQYAHLVAYATIPTQNSFIIEEFCKLSPRYDALVQTYGRGAAPTWETLSGKWATDPNYHLKIFENATYLTS